MSQRIYTDSGITDCNDSPRNIGRWTSTTLNSPYSAGLTPSTCGFLFSLYRGNSTNWNKQIGIGDGTGVPYVRNTEGTNTWQPWTKMIPDIKLVETVKNFKPSKSIPSHSGTTLTGVTSALIPSLPSGYTLIGHVNIAINGFAGLAILFDGSCMTSTSFSPYLFNCANGEVSTSANLTIRLYSLCSVK